MKNENAKHTRGPWHYKQVRMRGGPEDHVYVGTWGLEGGHRRLAYFSVTSPFSNIEAAANARLIAASPTMYEYIKKRAQSGDMEAQSIIKTLD